MHGSHAHMSLLTLVFRPLVQQRSCLKHELVGAGAACFSTSPIRRLHGRAELQRVLRHGPLSRYVMRYLQDPVPPAIQRRETCSLPWWWCGVVLVQSRKE
ncbi:hypothetical protein P280DRAFT_320682 [Massarina eburnea CBS 473.64]|uniref:Secreted protein n=1 Tax=Massarina eburnea CBS 473.64 TaxID=1395130 RepID=A0A6A6S0C5_9PLEO|nr:hypothetical protein P280DRAFT_320682 [Massarina eburnea CBS 473.64]